MYTYYIYIIYIMLHILGAEIRTEMEAAAGSLIKGGEKFTFNSKFRRAENFDKYSELEHT